MLSEEDRQAAVDTVKRYIAAAQLWGKEWMKAMNHPTREEVTTAMTDLGLATTTAPETAPAQECDSESWSEPPTREQELLNSLAEKEKNRAEREATEAGHEEFRRELHELRERFKEKPTKKDDFIRAMFTLTKKYAGAKGFSMDPDHGVMLMQMHQQIISEFLTVEYGNTPNGVTVFFSGPALSRITGESEAELDEVRDIAPDALDLIVREPDSFAGKTTQYVMRKVAGKWWIDGIYFTHPMTEQMARYQQVTLPSPHQEDAAGGWITYVPRPRLLSQLPVIDVEERFPFLRGRGREAVRLHPRRRVGLNPLGSKIGGSIAWPCGEPFPICPERHCRAVPVMQLHKRDVPQLPFPPGTDLFQFLWYPQNYISRHAGLGPGILLFWRDSSTLSQGHVLRPVYDLHEYTYVVQECEINPEPIVEYPCFDALSREEKQAISSRQGKNRKEDSRHTYSLCLSTAPGFKVGGYPSWRSRLELQTPFMDGITPGDIPLLTLESDEWPS
ncbi:MAG TPA: hypothetical protein VK970_13550, partial [Candidatus Methylacidiphilales bacterium]|nr:hypothetical protein [Candidatus Methylacidiphilales bacterium]